MSSIKSKYCSNCCTEIDADATECPFCGGKDFVLPEQPFPEEEEESHATLLPTSFGGKMFKVLAWIEWIGGFIWAIILADDYGIIGFLIPVMVFGLSGCILYAQSELFNCVHGIYALLKESKQK